MGNFLVAFIIISGISITMQVTKNDIYSGDPYSKYSIDNKGASNE